MPLKGNQLFPVQSGRFSFPRSYFSQLWLALEGNLTFTQTDNVIHFLYPPIPGYEAWFVFAPNFWEWSSNKFTLDYVLQYAYEKVTPMSPETPVTASLKYLRDETTGRNTLYVATIGPSNNVKILLPPPNQPYWCPDPEGTVPV